jgi:hypothetical protein
MPPQPISYPSQRPIPFALDPDAVRAAAAALNERAPTEPLRTALDTARVHLTSHAQLALDGGRLLLTSPRSERRYTCTRTRCDCDAFRFNRLCWHRAAAMIVRHIWDSAQPHVRCPHCFGPMIASRTHGGERSVSCLVCRHELPFVAVEALSLAAWHEPAAQQLAA